MKLFVFAVSVTFLSTFYVTGADFCNGVTASGAFASAYEPPPSPPNPDPPPPPPPPDFTKK
ncbi:MAG TPA: hypothetical protein PLD55_01600 [bacterium]|jgi:hypothetical protein|nr:hypothetical protein [bacterium]MDX9805180.1 hypothetical protein [bacterium]HNW15921.1 hypothetical protein [bacterium]HNZ54892.1 hypothetical protein [bacterium]HPG36218.1 hypothetical protein [bacterium]